MRRSGFLCDRKFLSHKTLREDAHLAEMKYMLRIPLGRERVASDSFSVCLAAHVSFARHGRALAGESPEHAQVVGNV